MFHLEGNDQDKIADYIGNVRPLFGKKDSTCTANWIFKQSIKNEAKIIQQTVNQKFYMKNFLNYQKEKDLIRITNKNKN